MPKLLWVSPFSLHDTSSGAAYLCRFMMEKLKERGFDVHVLGSFIFDHPWGSAVFTDLEEKLKSDKKFFQLQDKGVAYTYVKSASTAINAQTSLEQREFFSIYMQLLEQFTPDIIMGYGGDCLSLACRGEARLRGIPVVYALCNGQHLGWRFADCDLVLCEAQATVNLYKQKSRILAHSYGTFIRPELVVAEKREPKYVTLVNPHPSKGVSIFSRMALMAQEELPDVKFLVVQSRCAFHQSLEVLHLPDSEEKPFKPEMFTNVDVAQHTSNMKAVYAMTKVLLAPSLWYEAWGRVATEAVLNGIPVLCSTSGGLPEAMAGGGLSIPAPQECHDDYNRIPSEEEMRPWMDALKRLLTEDWTDACAKAAATCDIEKSTDRVVALLTQLMGRPASLNPHYLRLGSAP